MEKQYVLTFTSLTCIILSGMFGCASKSYVNEQLELLALKNQGVNSELRSIRSEIEYDIGSIWKELEGNQKDIITLREGFANRKEEFEKELNTVREELTQSWEAMARAEGKLRQGKLLYEVTISDESVFFDYKKSDLSEKARAELDTFFKSLIAEEKDFFIEIQGYTDNIGSASYNLRLGRARAESVRRYLHMEHKIPLHRINTFSYGESKPIVSNDTEKNRSKNRRVMLVVMQ